MKPKISIIVCTYNGEKLIRNCLNSIIKQNYGNFEILCMDGMSQDKTRDIIKEYIIKDKRIRLEINKNRLPEGKDNGKWIAFRKSKGEIIGIIDQDNIIQDKELFSKVIGLFSRGKNNVGILGGLKHDKSDSGVVRYVSLFGTDSFFAYRSVDFLRNFTKIESKRGCESIDMKENNMVLTGGNCFFYLKKSVERVGGYDQDVLVIKRLIINGNNKLFIIKDATKHYAESGMFKLTKKKFSWGEKYYSKDQERFDYFPKTKLERREFIKNLLFNLLILPNFIYSFKIFLKSKDQIAFMFLPIAFLNTIAYGLNFIKDKIST